LAFKIAKLINEKKGENILIINMRDVSIICDYFIITNGTSRIHNKAIANYIELTLKNEHEIKQKKIQGKQDGGWLLMDYGGIVIHIFLDNLRDYYNLEELWKDGELIKPEFQTKQKEELV